MPLYACFTKCKEQPCILLYFIFSHQVSQEKKTAGFTNMGMPAGAELSVFEKPSGIFYALQGAL
jgi:hypothetical protein